MGDTIVSPIGGMHGHGGDTTMSGNTPYGGHDRVPHRGCARSYRTNPCSLVSRPICTSPQDIVAQVAFASAWYTILGCVGVYLSGMLKDSLPKRHRATILAGNITVLILALGVMWFYDTVAIPFWLATAAVGGVGFSVFGAYKTSTGAFAVDIGGKEFKATYDLVFMALFFSRRGPAA